MQVLCGQVKTTNVKDFINGFERERVFLVDIL